MLAADILAWTDTTDTHQPVDVRSPRAREGRIRRGLADADAEGIA